MNKLQIATITQTILLIVFMFLKNNTAIAQEEKLSVLDNWREWSDGENMLIRHLNKQAYAYLDNREKEIAGLKTKEDWERRQKKTREILLKTVGPFPNKTSLNHQIIGTVKKEGYRIDKIIYESIPGFYVTGCLFLPDGADKKPAILFTSGHTDDSFRAESYQIMILNLVKKGFIVFAIDPIGQGERLQFFDPKKNAPIIGFGTREHNYLGDKTLLSGVSLARYFIWDGIRAVDYLLTRKEVDPDKIGVTGQSGGGTQAAYIFAFDQRVKAGAPVNFITGYKRLLESIGPQDAEQNFHHGILNGLNHADLIEVRAPNPLLISAGTRDFFSIQGARETYAEVYTAYKAFGKDENIEMIEDDFGHGFTVKIREGIYDFFQRNFNHQGNSNDEKVSILSNEELMVAPTGNIMSSFKNTQTVFDINKEEVENRIESLYNSRRNIENHLKNVQQEAKELSGYCTPDENIKSVFRGRYQRKGYSIEMHALHGEGECIVPLFLFVPKTGANFSSIIYLHPEGKNFDVSVGGKIEQLVRKGYLVAAPDLSGIGEVKDNNKAYRIAGLIGRSIAGIQAGDVNRVFEFLQKRSDIDSGKISVVSFDELGPTLLHAAAFNKKIYSVTLIGSLISYESIVMNKFYSTELASYFVAGALPTYDLPDLAAVLAPRKLNLINMRDGENEFIGVYKENSDIELIKTAWHQKNASRQLNIIKEDSEEKMFEQFLSLIE